MEDVHFLTIPLNMVISEANYKVITTNIRCFESADLSMRPADGDLECRLCHKVLRNRRDLKNHLAASSHRML